MSVPSSTPDESTPSGILHTLLRVAEKIRETGVDTAILSEEHEVGDLSKKSTGNFKKDRRITWPFRANHC